MDAVQIVFSPTGGTQRVANIITTQWGSPTQKIDLSDAALDFTAVSLNPSDVALIAVPSYHGRVPELAARRIRAIHGNHAKCVTVCVYGNRAYEDTLIELNDLAKESGFQVIAAIAAVAEHSIIHQYAAGRPDSQDQEELCSIAGKILEKINSGSTAVPSVPGNRPYQDLGKSSLVPQADGNCTACGLCAKQCPAGAISLDDIKTADSEKCIACMRCVSVCPQSARQINMAVVSAVAERIKAACTQRKGSELYI